MRERRASLSKRYLITFMKILLSVKCVMIFHTTFISRNQINIKQFVNIVLSELKIKVKWKGKGINEKAYDQKGNLIVAEGKTADDGMLAGMMVYVKGVEGDIPK